MNPALPEALPEAFGVKRMVTERLCPALRVVGSFGPRMANSELDDPREEILTAAPEAVSLAGRVLLDPTVTLPKLRAAGLTSSCAAVTPFPETSISGVGSTVLLLNLRTPEVCPTTVGAKTTGNRRLAPGLIVAGKEKTPNEKALPCTDREVMRSVLLPRFES